MVEKGESPATMERRRPEATPAIPPDFLQSRPGRLLSGICHQIRWHIRPVPSRNDMPIPEQLISQIYGELYALDDTEDPVYRSDGVPHCGLTIKVDVHCPKFIGHDRSLLLREVERRLQWFFAHEPLVRPSIADRAVQDMRGYWEGVEAEVPTGPELLGSLVLTSANCFPDSRYESWYSLPKAVANWDLSAEFDEGYTIHNLSFDG